MQNLIRYKYPLCCFLLTLLSGCFSHNQSSHIIKNNSFIITNINYLDVSNKTVLMNQTITIVDGIITSILPSLSNKHSTSPMKTIEGNGGYLTPGLIDMHVHAYDKHAFQLSLSHGVTHVRVMNGVKQHIAWKKEQQQGKWLASEMTVSSPIIRGGDKQPISWLANTEQEAKQLVHKANEQGYDLLKAYGSLSNEALSGLINEAKKWSIPVAKHGPHPAKGMPWKELVGLQSLEHVEDIYQGLLSHQQNETQLLESLKALQQLNVPVTPTLNIFWQLTEISHKKQHFLATQPGYYTSPLIAWEDNNNQVARWLNAPDSLAKHNQKTFDYLSYITKKLFEHNVDILVGSDAGVLLSPHGLATHNELSLLYQSGLSAFDVIRSATILPAKALDKPESIGQIKVGFQADFILTKDNPLQDLSRLKYPESVSIKGKLLSKKELVSLREAAKKNFRWLTELWVLMTNSF